ncbi:hypothetical protein PybrP1_007742, partial [[Pythium] brassicae (nom. inval.)]
MTAVEKGSDWVVRAVLSHPFLAEVQQAVALGIARSSERSDYPALWSNEEIRAVCGRSHLAPTNMGGVLPRLAALTGDSDTLRLLLDLRASPQYGDDPTLSLKGVVRFAVLRNCVGVLDCLAEFVARDAEWEWEPDLLSNLLFSPNVDVVVLEWLHCQLPQEMRQLDAHYMGMFAARGDFDMVRWLHNHGCPASEYAADCAATYSHREILEYIYDHTDARCSPDGVVQAAAKATLEVVSYVTANQTEATNELAFMTAARLGRLDVVQYFVEDGIGVSSLSAFDEAAQAGHLSVLQYLHGRLPSECSWRTMEGAAIRGHVGVVRFLHGNRREGCTPNAMNGAAARGHLSVVQFLHENRREGCS